MPSGDGRAEMGLVRLIGWSLASDSTQKRPILAGIFALGRNSLRQPGLAGGARRTEIQHSLAELRPPTLAYYEAASRMPTLRLAELSAAPRRALDRARWNFPAEPSTVRFA